VLRRRWKRPWLGDDRAAMVPPKLLWYRIFSLPAPRVTTRQTFHSQPSPAQGAMPLDRFEKIGGTRRMKTAAGGRSAKPGKQRRNRPLVGTDEEANEQNHRQGRRIGAALPRRNRRPFLFCTLALALNSNQSHSKASMSKSRRKITKKRVFPSTRPVS